MKEIQGFLLEEADIHQDFSAVINSLHKSGVTILGESRAI